MGNDVVRRGPTPPTGSGETAKAQIGRLGETWAAWFLRRQGYQVWARNWRNPLDQREELDLVCRDGHALVFVEVKTRSRGAPVPGHAALDIRKKRALRRAAQAFLRSLPLGQGLPTYRFDLVVVEWEFGQPPELQHYQNLSLRTPRPFR